MSPQKPVIDPAVIANLRTLNSGDGDDFLREIVELFFADMPVRLADLDRSLGAGDAPTFQRAAHSIKGSAASLGAKTLRGMAEDIENRAHASGLAGLGPLVAALRIEFAAVKVALEKIVRHPPA